MKPTRTEIQTALVEWMEAGINAGKLKKPKRTKSGLGYAIGRWPSTITAILDGSRDIRIAEIPIMAEYLDVPLPDVYMDTFKSETKIGIDDALKELPPKVQMALIPILLTQIEAAKSALEAVASEKKDPSAETIRQVVAASTRPK